MNSDTKTPYRRRPPISSAERARIVSDWQRSGLSAEAYAREHDVGASSLWKWSREERTGNGRVRKNTRREMPMFVEIPLSQEQRSTGLREDVDGTIELVCPSGHHVLLRGAVSASQLSTVLRSLEGRE